MIDEKRDSRTSGYVHSIAAILALILVVIIAVRANRNNPPPIAEFAPQANQVIKQAPQELTSIVGEANNGAATGGGTPKPGASGSPIPNPLGPPSQLLACVGNPPRQIEDPQSPPCVASFTGDNGGATWRGVTRDTIDIAWVYQGGSNNDQVQYLAKALERFFNKRFQFYNRRIKLSEQFEKSNSAADQQSQADDVAGLNMFASTQFTDTGGLQYHRELAHKGVVSSFGFEANPSEADLRGLDPYLWSYAMGSEDMLAMTGNWYCGVLNGHNAAHAGPLYQGTPRRLGIVYNPWDYSLNSSLQPLLDALSRCGIKNPNVINDPAGNQTSAVLNLSADKDTSVICICNYLYWSILADDAAGQGYSPEWLLTSYGGNDSQFGFHFGNAAPQQAQHAFGLTMQPRQVALANDPMWWGWVEGDQGPQNAPRTIIDMYQGHLLYRSLLEIAAGIQMAGPKLNPTTFAQGLHRAAFPNPITPIHAGSVDFFGGSHAMTVDAAQWWFDPTATSPWAAEGDPKGAICYVDGGIRHGITGWEGVADKFLGPTCDSGA